MQVEHFDNNKLVETSYVASVIIAKHIKPYTIGLTLVKTRALEMDRNVLGQESEKTLRQISLSNNTVQRRISD